MTKKIAKVLKAIAVGIFGVHATIWAGILLTFGCMKIYDIFWNPSSISVCFGSMNVGGYLSWFTMLAMVVCVYHMDQIINEETEEEIEES